MLLLLLFKYTTKGNVIMFVSYRIENYLTDFDKSFKDNYYIQISNYIQYKLG